MDSGVPPIGPLDEARLAARATRGSTPAAQAGADFHATLAREVDGMPSELRAELEVSARRWDELRAMDRELHFEHGADGRIVVELRDLEGNLIRTVPPSTALDIAAGAPV